MRTNLLSALTLGLVWAVGGCGDDSLTGGAGGEGGGASGGNGTGGNGTGGNGTGADGTGGSGTGGDGVGGAGPSDITTFCEAMVDPFCEATFACCTDLAVLEDFGGTVDACKTEFGDTCVTEVAGSLEDALAAGITALDDARLAACVARFSEIAATCDEPPLFAFFVCLGAFQGTVEPGDACGAISNDISFTECDGGLCGPEGTCIAYLPDGSPCVPGNDPPAFCDVTAGQWCNGASSTCEPRGDIGAECDATAGEKYQCLSLNCVGTSCVAPTPEGICQSGV